MRLSSAQQNQANAQWQWGMGITYALEAGKSLILINGAAAVGILTFIGNHPPKAFAIFRAINMFSAGAMLGVPFFAFAYLAQLYYGNRSFDSKAHNKALFWHWCAYLTALASVGVFAWGMYTATGSFPTGCSTDTR
jgi:hypothetical protein